jgi:hypothetical protein
MRRIACPAYPLLILFTIAACGGGSGDIDAAVDADPTLPDALEQSCQPASGTDIATQEVASGLNDPVWAGSPPGDGRLFIIEQQGRIRIVKNGQLLDTPFLDISQNGPNPRVTDNSNEQGLLGLAFHPEFAGNGKYYLNYSARDSDGATVVAEYTANGRTDLSNTDERRMLTVDQFAGNHNGGHIAFGPDGFLYIGMGDGGGGGDPQETGQDNTEMLGAMLRIDVDGAAPYGIPESNPFATSANGPDDPRPEIMHYGLRNPWRFSFDRQTGDLYIGDVGQDTQEEISVYGANEPPGANFGWDIIEGTSCHEPDPNPNCDGFDSVAPAVTLQHLGDGQGGPCSITGGVVYRGDCIPDIQGWYFYSDYCDNDLRKFEWDNGNVTNESTISGFFGSNISSFGEDAFGEVYIVARGDGAVYKIVPAP